MLDTSAIRAKWLRVCGNCDAGLMMACTCEIDDPRSAIEVLCNEVDYLSAQVDILKRGVVY